MTITLSSFYQKTKQNLLFILYICIYTFINLVTLTRFPLAHSDEAWLAGMSNEILTQQSLSITEPFFNLMPRTAHTMKSLFHLMQILMMKLFGNNLFSVRLLSFVCAVLILILLYQIMCHLYKNTFTALLITLLASVQIQFIYASHFARQEMPLTLILVLCYYLLIQKDPQINPNKWHLLIGALVGLAIGFHPNAFFIAAMIGLLFLKEALITKKIKALLVYIFTVFSFGLVNVFISLLINPNFITQYTNYGKSLSVDAPFSLRIENYFDFFLKLYYQIGGSYYLPPIQVYLMIFTLLILFFIGAILIKNKLPNLVMSPTAIDSLLLTLGYLISLFLIGRNNPTSMIFLWLPSVLLFSAFIKLFKSKKIVIHGSMLCLILLSCIPVTQEYRRFEGNDYANYLEQLQVSVEPDAVILGNLSGGFAFMDRPFYDIRNLAYLEEMSVDAYLKKYHINTIIYYEEYDYIHRNPSWQLLYENDFSFYEDLNQIIREKGTLIDTYEDYYYGTRIVGYTGDYPWKIWIYRLDN